MRKQLATLLAASLVVFVAVGVFLAATPANKPYDHIPRHNIDNLGSATNYWANVYGTTIRAENGRVDGALFGTDWVGKADFAATTTVPVAVPGAEVGDYAFGQVVSTTADPVKLLCTVAANKLTFTLDNASTGSINWMLVKKND